MKVRIAASLSLLMLVSCGGFFRPTTPLSIRLDFLGDVPVSTNGEGGSKFLLPELTDISITVASEDPSYPYETKAHPALVTSADAMYVEASILSVPLGVPLSISVEQMDGSGIVTSRATERLSLRAGTNPEVSMTMLPTAAMSVNHTFNAPQAAPILTTIIDPGKSLVIRAIPDTAAENHEMVFTFDYQLLAASVHIRLRDETGRKIPFSVSKDRKTITFRQEGYAMIYLLCYSPKAQTDLGNCLFRIVPRISNFDDITWNVVGSTLILNPQTDGTNTSFTFLSSDPSVAAVGSSGEVTPNNPGITYVTARVNAAGAYSDASAMMKLTIFK